MDQIDEAFIRVLDASAKQREAQMMWRVYLPKCTHHQAASNYCDNCIGVTLDNMLNDIIQNVSKFDATVIFAGEDETPEQKLINRYAEGTIQGYKDAVKQIKEFLEDLRASNNAA